MKYIFPIAGCMALFLSSCTKVIEVNLNDAAPQIVIEGIVTNLDTPYQVKITKTVNFDDNNIFPQVTGAIVKITDSTTGQIDLLLETSPGIYTTQKLPQGVPGHTYQLFISTGTDSYTASSTMPMPVNIDSVTFEHNTRLKKTTINPVVHFADPLGINNYYTFWEYLDGVELKQTFVFDDRLSDGRDIAQQLFNDSSYVAVGNSLTVQINCVDKKVWTYFSTLGSSSSSNIFHSTAPSNPVSNTSGSLGYFSAQAIQTKTVVVY